MKISLPSQKRLKLIHVNARSVFVFSRASVKPHDFVKLDFRRRSVHISGQLFIAMLRADENKKAAEHRFQKWYDEEESNMNRGCHHCNLQDSPLSEVRTRTPHMLLYFVVNVLKRLVDEFWESSESSEPYVAMCVATMSKCPPSIIGLLVYLRSPYLSPTTVRAFPPTSKDRIVWSELARAATQFEASPSASASVSAAAANDEVEFESFWSRFEDNVMDHFVWPAVRAGHIKSAPSADVDNPIWWRNGIIPILEHERVYQLHWKGSKQKARSCWTHVCEQLASHVFCGARSRRGLQTRNR